MGNRSIHATLKSENRGQQSPIVPILEDKENVRPVTASEALKDSNRCFLT